MFSGCVLHVRGFLRISYASNGDDVLESLLTSSIYLSISFCEVGNLHSRRPLVQLPELSGFFILVGIIYKICTRNTLLLSKKDFVEYWISLTVNAIG